MTDRIENRTAARRALRVPGRVKLGVAVAVASALVAGAAGGSRLPVLLEDGTPLGLRGASAAGDVKTPTTPGIAESVAAGPFHPVDGEFDYGEAGARFGASRGGRPHEGQDVFAKAGTPLVAVHTGVVIDEASESSAYSGGRGNFIAIYSEADDRTYVYFHMKERSPLREGDEVGAGEPVGAVGCTGSCWGDHLHFEVRVGRGVEGKAIDPMPLLRRWAPEGP